MCVDAVHVMIVKVQSKTGECGILLRNDRSKISTLKI